MLSTIANCISMRPMQHPRVRFTCISSGVSALTVALALVALGGCNNDVGYSVVAPATARGEVPRNAGAIVTRDKIDYEVVQDQDKVIVRFVNRTGQPLRLTEQSVMFDSSGRTFAVDSQDIPPDQAGRVLLPPAFAVDQAHAAPVATEVRVGGVDEGGLIGTRRDIEINEGSGGSPGARAAPPPGFRWPVNGQARLRLVYRVGDAGDELTHNWTLRRSR